MNFITHNFKEISKMQPIHCDYDKPAVCPHCSISCDPTVINHTFLQVNKNNNPIIYILLILECTACHKQIVAMYSIQNQHSTFLGMYPQNVTTFHDEQLQDLSPRFVKMYNQALAAKDAELFDLAAIGYRAAMEFLIKDYAVKESNEDPKNLKGKSLSKVIIEYLKDVPMVKTADMVRFLGNDAAHYDLQNPELDFKAIDKYMHIFVEQMSTALCITNPPRQRQNKD